MSTILGVLGGCAVDDLDDRLRLERRWARLWACLEPRMVRRGRIPGPMARASWMAERVEEGSEVVGGGNDDGDGEAEEEDGNELLVLAASRLGLDLGEGRIERGGMKGRSWWAI